MALSTMCYSTKWPPVWEISKISLNKSPVFVPVDHLWFPYSHLQKKKCQETIHYFMNEGDTLTIQHLQEWCKLFLVILNKKLRVPMPFWILFLRKGFPEMTQQRKTGPVDNSFSSWTVLESLKTIKQFRDFSNSTRWHDLCFSIELFQSTNQVQN